MPRISENVKLVLATLFLGVVSGALGYAAAATLLSDVSAQAVPTNGFLNDVWKAAQAAGIFGTFFMLWQFLRVDGRLQERDNERVALFREVVGLATTATSAINTVNSGTATQMATMNAVQQALLRVEGMLSKIENERGA